MSTNTILTSGGLAAVLSAGNFGPYIDVAFCLPIFDARLDESIHTFGTSAISFDSTIPFEVSAAVPYGEKIWNVPGYALSTSYIISGGTVSGSTVTNYIQSSLGAGCNTLSGNVLVDSFHGTSFSQPNTNANYWTIANLSGVIGINPQTSTDRSKYWRVLDYFPVQDSQGRTRGQFTCSIDNPVGRFKMNKIALYCVRVDGNGIEVSGAEAPIFFGEAYLASSVVKSDVMNEGFDSIVVDVQIELNSPNQYMTSGYYATSGASVFTNTVGGIYFGGGRCGIGSYSSGTNIPQAKLHVLSQTDDQLRLGYSDSQYSVISTTVGGNLEISATGGSVVPKTNLGLNLGSPSVKFNNIYASGVSATTVSGTTVNAVNVLATNIGAINAGISTITCVDISATTIRINNATHYSKITTDSSGYTNLENEGNAFLPHGNLSMDLGGPSNNWADVYTNNVLASTVEATTVSANDISGPISVAAGSSNASTNINFLTLSGTIASVYAGLNVSATSIITSANILDYSCMLESPEYGHSNWIKANVSYGNIPNSFFSCDYVYYSGVSQFYIGGRDSNVTGTNIKYRITVMYAS
jgi:hypothetical protein